MVRLDSGKLATWQQRLVKFQASGLSVAGFCRRENVSEASFYYWSRRVKDAGASDGRQAAMDRVRANDSTSVVEVLIGEQVKVRLPGKERELIHAVLERLQATATAGQSETRSGSAFRRIDVARDTVVLR